jgi:hypothetical protein
MYSIETVAWMARIVDGAELNSTAKDVCTKVIDVLHRFM